MAAPVATARTLNGVQDTPIDSDDAQFYRAKTGNVVPFGFNGSLIAQISFVARATRAEVDPFGFIPQGVFVGAFVKPATRGDIDPQGLTPIRSDAFWLSIPTFTIDRALGFPQFINNVRATYLVDPGGQVASVNVVDVDLGVISYDSANDRIVIASDPGSNVIDTVAMDAVLTTSTDVTVTSFTLTSVAGGTLLPFTIGMPFRQGDIPQSGQPYIASSSLANFEGSIRNRWPDGSVKFAVLSGRATLVANTALTVLVQKTSTAPVGANITEANLIALNPAVSMGLSGFTSVSLVGRFGSPVRSILGAQMSEFHYRSAVGADANLAVWYFCRIYKDLGTGAPLEIETCVENGYMKTAPGDKSYSATLIVNGTTRVSQAITHYQRTRWFSINWYDGTSGLTDFARVVPAHNAAYLRSTKLIPNYSTAATPTATYLNSLGQTIVPMGLGPYVNDNLGATAAAGHIGLLPQWEASYCVNADPRAWKSITPYVYAANGQAVCYRDENTFRPLALTVRPNISVEWGPDSPTYGTPNANPRVYDDGTLAHAPSVGYLGYLVTGRWTHLESLAFWTARGHMLLDPSSRGVVSNNGGGASTPNAGRQERQKAWHLRGIFQVATIYPDSSATWMPAADAQIRTDWIAALGQTLIYAQTNWITNNLGFVGTIFDPTSTLNETSWPAGTLVGKSWMMDFLTQAVGFGWDLGLSFSTPGSAHETVRNYFYKWPIGMYGDPATGWDYRMGLPYVAALGTYSGSIRTWDASFAAAFARQNSMPEENYVSTPSGTAITNGHFQDPDATSYGGNRMPAIVYAVDHLAPGAAAAYARLTGASNYAAFIAVQPNAPQWAVVPRP